MRARGASRLLSWESGQAGPPTEKGTGYFFDGNGAGLGIRARDWGWGQAGFRLLRVLRLQAGLVFNRALAALAGENQPVPGAVQGLEWGQAGFRLLRVLRLQRGLVFNRALVALVGENQPVPAVGGAWKWGQAGFRVMRALRLQLGFGVQSGVGVFGGGKPAGPRGRAGLGNGGVDLVSWTP